MNTIGMERDIPALPEKVERELLLAEIDYLEWQLRGAHPIFDEDLYLAIMEKLSGIYYQVNRMGCRSIRIKSLAWDTSASLSDRTSASLSDRTSASLSDRTSASLSDRTSASLSERGECWTIRTGRTIN